MSEIDEGLISGEQVVTRTAKHWFAPIADSKWAILMLLGCETSALGRLADVPSQPAMTDSDPKRKQKYLRVGLKR